MTAAHETHFKTVCARHGTIYGQCRCPGPKTERRVPCRGGECGAPVAVHHPFESLGTASVAVTRVCAEQVRVGDIVNVRGRAARVHTYDRTGAPLTTLRMVDSAGDETTITYIEGHIVEVLYR